MLEWILLYIQYIIYWPAATVDLFGAGGLHEQGLDTQIHILRVLLSK